MARSRPWCHRIRKGWQSAISCIASRCEKGPCLTARRNLDHRHHLMRSLFTYVKVMPRMARVCRLGGPAPRRAANVMREASRTSLCSQARCLATQRCAQHSKHAKASRSAWWQSAHMLGCCEHDLTLRADFLRDWTDRERSVAVQTCARNAAARSMHTRLGTLSAPLVAVKC